MFDTIIETSFDVDNQKFVSSKLFNRGKYHVYEVDDSDKEKYHLWVLHGVQTENVMRIIKKLMETWPEKMIKGI